MKRLWLVILLLLGLLALNGALAQEAENLIAPYEKSNKSFDVYEIGDYIVYWHQRTLGGAIVEKDFTNYIFNKENKELIEKKERWRKDIPEEVPPGWPQVIPQALAMAMVPGEVQFAELYIISPESDVFPIQPTPTNPCWVVRTVLNERQAVFVIDAITGQDLGRGLPPPYESFSLTGPTDQYSPCSGGWNSWYQNARDWFNTMGYPAQAVRWPSKETIRTNAIQNPSEVLFYELAHGGSTYFYNACDSYTTATDIKNWIAGYRKFPFVFIGSCGGMCNTGAGNFSYEFRKGSTEGTTVVGYCHMDASYCSNCWGYSVSWQDTMFARMNAGYTVKQAFDYAMAQYPTCAGTNNCMRFDGDTHFKLKTRDEILGAGGSWSAGFWYYNLAQAAWYRPYSITPDRSGIPIAVGDVNNDKKADMISVWSSGLWWQNGATWGWTKVYSIPPGRVTVGDTTGDGWAEIIGTWGNGIWWWNVRYPGWTKMHDFVPSGAIAAGDINGDGKADVASIWSSGLWWQNGATFGWTLVYNIPPSSDRLAVADITGDGRAEIIATWSDGIWYRNVHAGTWTKMYGYVPSGRIAAGDVSGDGRADVVSVWTSGLWYQDGRTLGWTKLYGSPPGNIAVGNISGN